MARRKFKRTATTRRRSGSRTPSRRRRRVGATSAMSLSANSPLVKIGAAVLGFLKPDLLPLQKLVGDKVDPKVVAIGEGGLGLLLAKRKKGGKGLVAILTTAGSFYMIGAGAKKAMQAFGIGAIGPYGRVPVVAGLSPYGRVPVIGNRTPGGGFTPNGTLGYSPSGTINKVMTGVGDNSSGSGHTSNVPGSSYMN